MEKLFLSYSFAPEDRELASAVEAVIESYNIRVVTGIAVGGQALTPTIMNLIEGCDGLVALMTPRLPRSGKKFSSPTWVHDELNHSRALKKRNIALVDTRIALKGAYGENEHINYDPTKPLHALTKLVQTLGLWKREAGRQVKVLIQPEHLSRQLGGDETQVRCEYRAYGKDGKRSEWQVAAVVPEMGGAVAYLSGVQEDALIELRIKVARETWISPAVAPWMHVELKKESRR